MTTPQAPEAPEADLVRRTLRSVADGLDVSDAPLPVEARTAAPPAPAPAAGRRPGWRAGAALVAAAAILSAGVWAVLRTTDQAQDTSPRPPADGSTESTDGFPHPRWLPDDLAGRSETTGWSAAVDLAGGTLVVGPRADDVGVAAHVRGGIELADPVAWALASFVGPGANWTPPATDDLGPDATTTVVSRSLPPAVADQLLTQGRPQPEALGLPAGWTASPLDLGWAPDVGETVTSSFGVVDNRPSLRLHAVSGRLPEPTALSRLLVSDRQVAVGREPAWIAQYGSGSQRALLWQQAPDVVAVVVGWGVAEGDMVRVAEQAQWPGRVVLPQVPERPADTTARGPTTTVYAMSGPEDWMTLCGPRPGDPALPGEDDGGVWSGVIGVTGQDDIAYNLLLWDDRVTGGGERTGPCWRLDVAGAERVRGGGDLAGLDLFGVRDLVPVAWTAEETVFFTAHDPGVTLTAADAEVVTTELDARLPDGTSFSFVRVARNGSASVLFDVIHDGRVVGDLGTWLLDRP
jgi:hypothetical protein